MDYKSKAEDFVNRLEYKTGDYKKRNFGHPWHSMCSYRGKLKPAIAHLLVKNFSEPGQLVLDPLGGVGTIPFEASLQGRIGVGNDLSKFAYIVTKAKLEPPVYKDVIKRLDFLSSHIDNYNYEEIDYSTVEFGLNGKINEYFEENTLDEILILREYFINHSNKDSVDALILTSFAHVLHGNRPYALSRNSHSLTPYAPSGEFVYKNVIEHITNKVNLIYRNDPTDEFIEGKSIHGDYRNLTDYEELKGNVDVIISSPPFAQSLNFYSQNWMRLWLVGWEPEDFKDVNPNFLEVQQKYDLDIYNEFFKNCVELLKTDGKVVLHLGNNKKVNMGEELSKIASKYLQVTFLGVEDTGKLESFGLADNGSTIEHQFLFLEK